MNEFDLTPEQLKALDTYFSVNSVNAYIKATKEYERKLSLKYKIKKIF